MSRTATLLADVVHTVDELLEQSDLDACLVEDLHRMRTMAATRLRSMAPYDVEPVQ